MMLNVKPNFVRRIARPAVFLAAVILAFSITVGASGAPSAPPITAISAGGGHTCVLTREGGVKCWGSNRFGQIGNGVNRKCNRFGKCTKPVARRPADVVGLARGVKAIAAGGSHTCALMSGGGVKCWGYNASGQLGNGQTPCSDAQTCVKNVSSRPVDVVGLQSGVRAIAVGDHHTCAITSNGGVKCWGDNENGQLGTHTTEWRRNRSTPVDVVGLGSGVRAITAGAQFSCAVTTASEAKCWGAETPLFTAASGITAIAIGAYADTSNALHAFLDHVCLLTTSGGVKCWGPGKLGTDPLDVAGLTSGVRAIAAGSSYTCALTNRGGVKCWGHNFFGTLGDGTTTNRGTPSDVAGLTSGVTAVATGAYHACALTSAGGVKCWGWNYAGTLGDGSKAGKRTKPVDVSFSQKPSAQPPAKSPGGSTTTGSCSKAKARQVATSALPHRPDLVAKAFCGPFVGPGSQAMVVAFTPGTCGINGWAVFSFTGGKWRLVGSQQVGWVIDLAAVGSDIRETAPVPTGRFECPTSGRARARIWHWNGSRLVAGPWKHEPEARGFDSPSLNINCGMFDDSSFRQVVCQSRTPPQKVTMDGAGRVTICIDPTPSNPSNDCNLGDRGEGPIRPLAYGRQITVGRFRCLSLEIGVRCTVIRSGKGFLINRDGVSRVGP